MPSRVAKRVIVSLSPQLLEFVTSPRFGGCAIPAVIRQFIVESKAFAEYHKQRLDEIVKSAAKGARHGEMAAVVDEAVAGLPPRPTTITVVDNKPAEPWVPILIECTKCGTETYDMEKGTCLTCGLDLELAAKIKATHERSEAGQ
jgi:hypothetical protein